MSEESHKTLEEQIRETILSAHSGQTSYDENFEMLRWETKIDIRLATNIYQLGKRLGHITDFVNTACEHFIHTAAFEEYVREQLDPRLRKARLKARRDERERYTRALRKMARTPEEVERDEAKERERREKREGIEERRERRKELKKFLKEGEKHFASLERRDGRRRARREETVKRFTKRTIVRRRRDREEVNRRLASERVRDEQFWKDRSLEMKKDYELLNKYLDETTEETLDSIEDSKR